MLARLALAAAAIPLSALGADFAPEGTPGTLTVKISVEGGARQNLNRSAAMLAREWKVKNSAQLSIRMVAVGATGLAGQGSAPPGMTEDDQAVLDRWDQKRDACRDNEECENRVMGAMIADPAYQRAMQRMQGGVNLAALATASGPSMQVWSTDPRDPAPASGKVAYDLWENAYGALDSAGGGRVDVKCQYKGSFDIGPGSPEAHAGASLRIDAASSRYEIRLPGETFAGELPESCWDSKTGSQGKSPNTRRVRLIGVLPLHAKRNFDALLSAKGPVASTRSPQIGGKQSFTTELLEGNAGEPVPVKVTVDWRFFAAAR